MTSGAMGAIDSVLRCRQYARGIARLGICLEGLSCGDRGEIFRWVGVRSSGGLARSAGMDWPESSFDLSSLAGQRDRGACSGDEGAQAH